MGLKQLPTIRDELLGAGRPKGQSMALISKAATPAQHVVITSIDACVRAAGDSGIEAPVLIAVGDVVDLQSSLDWFDALELGDMPPFSHD